MHLVSFGNPDPPNYGGAIDVHYKIKALKEQGVNVILHFFHEEVDRTLNGLGDYCHDYHAYWRKTGVKGISPFIPYIVYSRRSRKLLENLQKDDYPILFEGLHSTIYLTHPSLKNRLKLVRTHNKEHLYYQALADNVSIGRDSFYFQTESYLLKRYEKILSNSDVILAISREEKNYFSKYQESIHVPCFHQNKEVDSLEGTGEYNLFQGDLSIPKNEQAARFFIDKVNPGVSLPLKVAGLNPTESFVKYCADQGVELIANPSPTHMKDLIQNAQILFLKSDDTTGIKLKWIHSLFSGRHILANRKILTDKNLLSLSHETNSADDYISLANTLEKEPFTKEMINTRVDTLKKFYDNSQNAKLIIDLLP